MVKTEDAIAGRTLGVATASGIKPVQDVRLPLIRGCAGGRPDGLVDLGLRHAHHQLVGGDAGLDQGLQVIGGRFRGRRGQT